MMSPQLADILLFSFFSPFFFLSFSHFFPFFRWLKIIPRAAAFLWRIWRVCDCLVNIVSHLRVSDFVRLSVLVTLIIELCRSTPTESDILKLAVLSYQRRFIDYVHEIEKISSLVKI